jgi:hypothetical protein
MIGAAKTALLPDATLSGVRTVHSIGTVGLPTPASPGIPAGSGGVAALPNEQSKINEFPDVLPSASEVERVGPEPPGSSGFFQIYAETGPDVGESPL